MRVPEKLASAFGEEFQRKLGEFALTQGWIESADQISNERFLARSVLPHLERLTAMFNRVGDELGYYWNRGSNPANLRLAYFLMYMPANLYRIASVWSELGRLGFKWPFENALRAVDFGSGPAVAACGIGVAESLSAVGLPSEGNWALIEQDKPLLKTGVQWAPAFLSGTVGGGWDYREFAREIQRDEALLPERAPKFQLWTMSFFLNELKEGMAAADAAGGAAREEKGKKAAPVGIWSAAESARALLSSWRKHLEEEGVVILVEPALRDQSRYLLELRREILAQKDEAGISELQVLLPCLGNQPCGALALEGDWCHEEVMWWRPPYLRKLDEMAKLDHKSLPFSYLVLIRSRRAREEILPGLVGSAAARTYRLVSPAHSEGRDWEFFVCGQDGKRRARWRPDANDPAAKGSGDDEAKPMRGDILMDTDLRGDPRSSRVEKIGRKTKG